MATSRTAGFTLLEMLVVLLITGMAMALTFQVLGQFQRAHARVGASERTTREQRLSDAWFRESVQGLYPAADPATVEAGLSTWLEKAELEPVFSGDADGFTGVTLSPVWAGQGIPTVQHWKIIRAPAGARLELMESGSPSLQLQLRLPHADEMRFLYLDTAGKSYSQWPPAKGQETQLPASIVLELQNKGSPVFLIAAAIRGPRDHPPFLRYETEEL